MAISFYSEEIELPAINQEAVREWVRAVAKTYGKKAGEISYIFCSRIAPAGNICSTENYSGMRRSTTSIWSILLYVWKDFDARKRRLKQWSGKKRHWWRMPSVMMIRITASIRRNLHA